MQLLVKSLSIFFAIFVLMLSSNLMAQWQKQDFPSDEILFKVRFANERVGWIQGQNHVYKTDDAGLNWVVQDTSFGGGTLYALSDQTVFYTNYQGRGIHRTTDGGLHWEEVDTLSILYTDFAFVNDQVGFVIGMDKDDINYVRKTTDAGATWNTVSTNFLITGYFLEGISFVDALQGWILSYDGYVYHTTDGGTNWALQDSIQGPDYWLPMRDICFATADSGWAVGGISGNMVVARTIDGGENWIVDIEGGNSLREVTFLNSHTGWFVGWSSGAVALAKTTNGGVDWEYQDLVPPLERGSGGFESISMININTGWVVGGEGKVYNIGYTSGIGPTIAPNQLPDRFVLEQNYPNPFNPATIIRYSIPASDHVTLDVYTVSGQKVATLVNKPQAAGTYEVAFNGDQLSGGIYFYRITSGVFSQIRKMVLLK